MNYTAANAKINIGLNIIEKRSDNYHNIETLFYPVHFLFDELIIEQNFNSENEVILTESGIQTDSPVENNLVVKAFKKLSTIYNLGGTSILLKKNIPVGAGLGGGSSDAAFTVKILNDLYHIGLTDAQMEDLVVDLGADCPVFIRNKPVFATGTGNIFSSYNEILKGKWLKIIKPDIYVSTKEAYAGVIPQKPESGLTENLQRPLEEWKNHIKNDFETSVFKQYPEIGQIKDSLYKSGAVYASMSGSGSSVYGIFDEEPIHVNLFKTCSIFTGML